MSKALPYRPLAMIALLVAASHFSATLLLAADVDFNRDIRPILSNNCFHCHGPDPENREADLRLDVRESVVAAGAIDLENLSQSEIIARITTDDADQRMPPPGSEKSLSAHDIELVKQWVSDGANYSDHWAFTPPVRPLVPQIDSRPKGWQEPVDQFILQRIRQSGLEPNPRATDAALVRRLYLDLIGLPPSPDQVDAYLNDDSPDKYDQLVNELLSSVHFGERWARWWLDAARYSDSDGYEKDKQREVWFYRDWVIAAMNQDKPYDEFIIEQIAGDLLPQATQNEIVATGFLRNSMVNEEGGADPEQFRVEGMFDRIDAIGKSILGITTQCAQCHTHKYDPLTQAEYYQMFAALNDFHEAIVTVYTPQQSNQVSSITEQIIALNEELKSQHPNWQTEMLAWRDDVAKRMPVWTAVTPTSLPYDGQKFRLLDDASVVSESYAPTQTTVKLPVEVLPNPEPGKTITAFRLDALLHPQLPHGGPGRSIYGTGALTEFECRVATKENPSEWKTVKIAQAYSDVNPKQTTLPPAFRQRDAASDDRITGGIDFAIDSNNKTAWSTDCGPASRNQDRHAVFVPEQPLEIGQGLIIEFSLAMNHGGWNSDDNQNYLLGRYRFSFTTDEVPPDIAVIPSRVEGSLECATSDQTSVVFDYWRTTQDAFAPTNEKISALQASHPEPTSQLAVQQLAQPRQTFVMLRGDFLKPGDKVEPNVPGFLNPMNPTNEPARLQFARWLVADDAPTTARVIVNRMWQSYFGRGIVTTPEDFGFQSPPPTNPELLDYLAVELMESNWSLKHVHRLIVTSQAYQQSSTMTAEALEEDPANELLGRGPRFRVDGEVVRDIALTASGLLNTTVGGPSVYPPAPEFLFQPPASYGPKIWSFKDDSSQYRRSLYVHSYRSVQHPPLQVFDAPKGDAACVRRDRSNTPLQALVLLNEPQMMDCARGLANRALREIDSDATERIRYIHQVCTSRFPDEEEVDILHKLLEQQQEHFSVDSNLASELVGVSASDCLQLTGRSVTEVAAWIIVARAVLNLDETITKE